MSRRNRRLERLITQQDPQDRLVLPTSPPTAPMPQKEYQMSSSPVVESPRVYLAGKIAKYCWRHQIYPDLRNTSPDNPPRPVDGFSYAGPYFISCDHGCYHGPGRHGIGARGGGCEGGDWEPRESTHRLCRRWLESANVVFAYIDGPNPFGTILEIGIAVGLKIPVYLAFGLPFPKRDIYGQIRGMTEEDADRFDSPSGRAEFLVSSMTDMWLASEMVDEFNVFGTPGIAWKSFVSWYRDFQDGKRAEALIGA